MSVSLLELLAAGCLCALILLAPRHAATTHLDRRDYRYEGLPLPLILNGRVQDGNLEKIGKTRFWLKNRLQEMGATKFRDVRLCTIDYRGKLYLRFDDFAAKSR